jgi:type II secretion system protein C
LTSNTIKQKTIFRLALLVSAGVFALVLYQSVTHLLKPQATTGKPGASSAQTTTQPKQKPRNPVVYRQISNWHLFGIAQKDDKRSTGKQAIDAPETNLNLSLLGVLFNPNPEESRAIIAEQGKSHKSYKVGDPLPRKAILHSIEAGRVILSRNGRHESLKLKKLKLPGENSDSGFNDQRTLMPGRETAHKSLNPPGEHSDRTHDARQPPGTEEKKEEKSALGQLPAPPLKQKTTQTVGRAQDV